MDLIMEWNEMAVNVEAKVELKLWELRSIQVLTSCKPAVNTSDNTVPNN